VPGCVFMTMKVTGPSGDSLELRIAGYQFPANTSDYFDANWLYIEAEAAIAGRSWIARDPSLCTFEVKELYEWLRELADHSATRDSFEAMEPNYRFTALGQTANSKHRIRVLLELEVRPPWTAQNSAYHNDCWIDLQCSSEELLAWSADLEVQLSEFPVRGEALVPTRKWDEDLPKKSRWNRIKSLVKGSN
jgi:hypothetical protein